MIFDGGYEDECYRRWFAWHPVKLRGPDEWDRIRRLRCSHRWVWLQFVWRLRTKPSTYYALPDAETQNALLLSSMDGRLGR